MNKLWKACAAVLSLVMLAAACGGDAEEEGTGDSDTTTAAVTTTAATTTTAAADPISLIYVTPGPIGINPFLSLGEVGTQRAAERLGGTWKTFESNNDTASQRSNIEAAIEEGPDVVVLTTFTLLEMADEFSKANPDQQFILIDACPDDPAPNLHCGVFREHEGAYLLGIMAGNLTVNGQIGSVVALDIPFFQRWWKSFELGAMSVNPDIENSVVFIGGDNPFADPARAKELALSLAAQGPDHIFAVGAGSNGGVFEAAEEAGFMAYGVDINECPSAPGRVVDNNLKLVDVLVDQLVEKVIDGTAGPVESFGLAEGGTGVMALHPDLADSQCLIADYPSVIDAVEAASQGIIDGSIVVPDPLFS